MLLFYILQKDTLTKAAYFEKDPWEYTIQDPKVSGSSVTLVQISMSATLLLLIIGNY